jgi:hypothetical protein
MKKISEYEAHAEECRKMAGQMKNPAHKQQLIDMAEAWEMLAKARAKQLQQSATSLAATRWPFGSTSN